MGFSPVSGLILVVGYAIGYATQKTGVAIPGIGSIDVFGTFIKDKPQSVIELIYENYMVWAVCYFTAHFLMYVEPQKSLLRPFKLNPNYPPFSLVLKEIFRSIRGKNNHEFEVFYYEITFT